MLRNLFAFIILLHGLIHFMGFAKAFGYGNLTQLTKEISKPAGCCWLLTASLFIVAALLFIMNKESWAVVSIPAVVISQLLIIVVWKDAKLGTIANIIVLLVAIPAIAKNNFNKMVKHETSVLLSRVSSCKESGIFQFSSGGDMTSFSGERWFGNGNDATLEKWFIETKNYQSFQGIRVPRNCKVTWKLKSGDFNWLKLDIAGLEFNKYELYK